MQTNSVIFNKQLSVKYAGSMQKYESFKRMMGASPQIYSHDFHVYNDDIITRHNRNIKQLRIMKSLLKQGKLQTSMIPFNVFNTYYPSYVLHHHYEVFIPILSQLATHQPIKQLLAASTNHEVTGAFFSDKLTQDFKEAQKCMLNEEGLIEMSSKTFFFSGVTSPYITHCALVAHTKSGLRFVVVALRAKDGSLIKGVTAKDLGATASNDYIPIGYNLSGVKPLIAIQIPVQICKKMTAINSIQRFHEFGYSLKDFQKSLWVTINYTGMRKQFKTNDNNKQERRIITYQAVATRIINGFAQFVALSDFYSRVADATKSFLILNQIIESSHHIILQSLIHLRECCGGFGFMQVSGHPGCIQRVCFRAGSQIDKDLKLTPEYLQLTQYYASSQESQKYYCQQITEQKPSYMNYFGVFVSIIFRMRSDKGKLTSIQYKREFLRQSSLIAMHAREEFSRNDATNIHCQLLQFAIAQYILKNSSFIDWSLIKVPRTSFLQRLEEFRNEFLQSISAQLQNLGSTLELSYLRNTILGRQNSEQFYKQVLQTSKKNLKNEKSYLEYVQAPIIEMVTANRAKL